MKLFCPKWVKKTSTPQRNKSTWPMLGPAKWKRARRELWLARFGLVLIGSWFFSLSSSHWWYDVMFGLGTHRMRATSVVIRAIVRQNQLHIKGPVGKGSSWSAQQRFKSCSQKTLWHFYTLLNVEQETSSILILIYPTPWSRWVPVGPGGSRWVPVSAWGTSGTHTAFSGTSRFSNASGCGPVDITIKGASLGLGEGHRKIFMNFVTI